MFTGMINSFKKFLRTLGIDFADFFFYSVVTVTVFSLVFSEWFSVSREMEERKKNDGFREKVEKIEKTVKDFTTIVSEKLYPTNLFPSANYRMFNTREYIERNTYYPNVHTNIHLCDHAITILSHNVDEKTGKTEPVEKNPKKFDVTNELESVTIKVTLFGVRAVFKFKGEPSGADSDARKDADKGDGE